VIVLGLDLASETGWARRDHAGRIEIGTVAFTVRHGESAGMRYLKFNKWLDEVLTPAPMFVAYEQGIHRGGPATEIAYGLSTRVIEACTRLAIDYAPVNVTTLKKWTTGIGNAAKPLMLQAVNTRWRARAPLTNHNEADALAVLMYALHHYVQGE
jgi:Holliday junction resolvasome RuvABC endonuclease subunit